MKWLDEAREYKKKYDTASFDNQEWIADYIIDGFFDRLLEIAERAERSPVVHRGIKIGENCGVCGKLWFEDKSWGHADDCPFSDNYKK